METRDESEALFGFAIGVLKQYCEIPQTTFHLSQKLEGNRKVEFQGLIVCQTRGVTIDVWSVLNTLGKALGVRVQLCLGGFPLEEDMLKMRDGADIVLGTPGRILDMTSRNAIDLGKIKSIFFFHWTTCLKWDLRRRWMLEKNALDNVQICASTGNWEKIEGFVKKTSRILLNLSSTRRKLLLNALNKLISNWRRKITSLRSCAN